MKLVCLPVLLTLMSLKGFSQGVIYEKKFPLNHTSERFRPDSYAVKNKKKGETALFVLDKEIIHGIVFDSLMQQTNQLSAKRPEGNYRFLLGGLVAGEMYYLIFSDRYYSSMLSVGFDYTTKKVTTKAVDNFIRDEKDAAFLIVDDKLYLFTTVKGSTDLKLHAFDAQLNHKEKSYEFDKKMFASVSGLNTFKKIIENSPPVFSDGRSPVSLELAVNPNKIFTGPNQIILTIDRLAYATAVFQFDLSTLEVRTSLHNYKFVNCRPGERRDANSFFLNGRLFQLNLCNSGMAFTVKDLTSNQQLKEFLVYEDDKISWANTEFLVSKSPDIPGVVSTGPQDEDRTVTKTKQFLGKSSRSFVGAAVHPDNENVIITIGGLMGILQSNIAPLGGYHDWLKNAAAFDPVVKTYRYYAVPKSISFRSQMNATTLEHVAGDVRSNSFDKIKEFQEMQTNLTMDAETVFEGNKNYILGYYNVRTQSYIMRSF
jgi:hypothetical protein